MVSTLTLFTTYINANIGQNETVENFVTLIKALNTIINARVRYNNQLLTLITTITTYTECNKDALTLATTIKISKVTLKLTLNDQFQSVDTSYN